MSLSRGGEAPQASQGAGMSALDSARASARAGNMGAGAPIPPFLRIHYVSVQIIAHAPNGVGKSVCRALHDKADSFFLSHLVIIVFR